MPLNLREGNRRKFLTETNAGTSTYWHRKVEKDKTYKYVLVAGNNQGREGQAANLEI